MANRTPVLLGSGIASAGGVFVGSGINISGIGEGADALSGQSHEYNVPGTQHAQLVKNNYFLNIPLSRDMGGRITQTTQIEEDRNLNFSSHKCFQNFFPGAELVHERSNKDTRRSVNTSNKASSSTSNNKSAIGCSTMQLSYLYGQSEEGKDIIKGLLFKSEIVAKSENEGLALGTTGYAKDGEGTSSAKGRQYLTYRFVYLYKKADDTGEVKGGYEGEDTVNVIINISAYIKVPQDQLGLDTKHLKPSRSNMWEYKEFSGIGKETKETEGKGIFNDMEVRIADDNTKCEVMCENFNGFSNHPVYDIGFKTAQYQYSPKEKKGFYLENNVNKKEKEIPALLDSYYSGIKNKKGKGENLHAMCADRAKAKVEDDSDGTVKEDLINFCYSKKK